MNKDWKKNIAYEVLVILSVMALLTFICRLWPILLLVMIDIIIAAIRLLFLSFRKVKHSEPMLQLPSMIPEPTEKDVHALAYSVILRRITELVLSDYPNARWVWEAPNAKQLIECGEAVYILLNRAGGFRRARVVIRNLRVIGIDYNPQNEEPVANEISDESMEINESENPTEPMPVNYGLIAYEWVEANIMDLNARCNDAIGEGLTSIILQSEELPAKDSWQDLCKELNKAGLEDTQCVTEGIKINLKQ